MENTNINMNNMNSSMDITGMVGFSNPNIEVVEKFFLKPQYDLRKSFHKKAEVEVHDDNSIHLYSYHTEVAIIRGDSVVVNGTYSQTTLRHLKEFLLQNGFRAESKAQIENDYMRKKK